MTDNSPKELWTSAEAAEYIGMDQDRLVNLARIGKVPGAWKGKSDKRADWRFDVEKIKAYKRMRDERAAKLQNMMTVAEAALFIRYSPETIRRLTRQGKIKACKDDDGPKAEWRYAKEDLLAYFAKPEEIQA